MDGLLNKGVSYLMRKLCVAVLRLCTGVRGNVGWKAYVEVRSQLGCLRIACGGCVVARCLQLTETWGEVPSKECTTDAVSACRSSS